QRQQLAAAFTARCAQEERLVAGGRRRRVQAHGQKPLRGQRKRNRPEVIVDAGGEGPGGAVFAGHAVATVVGFQLVAGAVAVDVEVVHADLAPYRGRAEQVDALGGDGDAHLQPAELGGYAELPERADVPEVEARDVVGAEGLAAGDGAGSDVEVLFFKAQ